MLALLAALYLSLPVQAPSYRAVLLEDMGFGPATTAAINSAGIVAGSVPTGASPCAAAIWDRAGHVVVLDGPTNPATSSVASINASGVMVGGNMQPTTQSVALIWTLKGGSHVIPSPTPSSALDINNAGDMLLTRFQPTLGARHYLIERDGTEHLLAGFACGLSNNQFVAGHYWQGGTFRWSPAGYEDLPPLPGELYLEALGIGPDGTVCGASWGGPDPRATLWGLDGTPVALPLAPLIAPGASAYDVNAGGLAVGIEHGYRPGQDPEATRSFAILWGSGSAFVLEDLVSEGPYATLTFAAAMNDAGQIVCSGLLNGQPVAVRLDPL